MENFSTPMFLLFYAMGFVLSILVSIMLYYTEGKRYTERMITMIEISFVPIINIIFALLMFFGSVDEMNNKLVKHLNKESIIDEYIETNKSYLEK